MQIEPSKARILADCIEGMAADAEDKGKDSFGVHLSLEDAHMITRSLIERSGGKADCQKSEGEAQR